MKLQVTQENLNKALSSVSRIANTRSTLPILSNVLIKTIGKRLSIASTNLDIAITHLIGSKVAEEGSITVPARLLTEFVSNLPSGTISLELDETKLRVTTANYESTINGASAEDYPVMPSISEGNKWEIPARVLKEALTQIIVAASSDDARPILTGVYVHNLDGKLVFVSTDSYRLAEKTTSVKTAGNSLLIPANALNDLLRVLDETVDNVQIISDEQQVQFKAGDVELVARLLEGTYPDYRKLIPEKFAHSALVDKKELISITKVSALFARESAGSVTLELDSAAKTISIKSIASQLGENNASASAEVDGDGSITLNSRYILDALNSLAGDKVKVAFNNKLEPCVLSSPDNKDYIHVIMPLKS